MCSSDLIADSENFALDNALEKYAIHAELVEFDGDQTNAFFARQKVKGVLPRGEFATLYANQLLAETNAFKEKIVDYVLQTPHSLFAQLAVPTKNGEITLAGNVDRLYGEPSQRVTWRMATVKDKDRIEAWLYHLLLCATQPQPTESIFQDKDKRENFSCGASTGGRCATANLCRKLFSRIRTITADSDNGH